MLIAGYLPVYQICGGFILKIHTFFSFFTFYSVLFNIHTSVVNFAKNKVVIDLYQNCRVFVDNNLQVGGALRKQYQTMHLGAVYYLENY